MHQIYKKIFLIILILLGILAFHNPTYACDVHVQGNGNTAESDSCVEYVSLPEFITSASGEYSYSGIVGDGGGYFTICAGPWDGSDTVCRADHYISLSASISDSTPGNWEWADLFVLMYVNPGAGHAYGTLNRTTDFDISTCDDPSATNFGDPIPCQYPPPPGTFILDVNVHGDGQGRVTGSPAGENGSINCENGYVGSCIIAFNPGEVVTLTPTAGNNSDFAGWTIGVCYDYGLNPCVLTMNSDVSLGAVFRQTGGVGNVNANLTASPNLVFIGEEVEVSWDNFEPEYETNWVGFYNASVAAPIFSPTNAAPNSNYHGWGSFNLDPPYTDTWFYTTGTDAVGQDCDATVRSGARATWQCGYNMPSTPGIYKFWGFVEDEGSGEPADPWRESNHVTVVPYTYSLTVNKAGSGTGEILSSPAGINCAAACASDSHDFAYSADVTLDANPSLGSAFTGWTGDADCTDGSVTMDDDKTCIATFSTDYTLTVIIGGGTGTVTGTGINCPGDCTETYTSATNVTLTAVGTAGHTFSSWIPGAGSICGGDPSVCNDLVDTDKTARVNFAPQIDYSLSMTSPTVNITKTSTEAYGNDTVIKTLNSGNAQPVSLSLSGVPGTGVSYTITHNPGNPANPCGASCRSIISFTVLPSAPVGSFPIIVTGDIDSEQTNFTLNIQGNPMTVSCSATPSTALLGETVTWQATVTSGGTGVPSFEWSGTNVPTSPAPAGDIFTISYGTIGLKTATVTVTDEDDVEATCMNNVYINFDPQLEEF